MIMAVLKWIIATVAMLGGRSINVNGETTTMTRRKERVKFRKCAICRNEVEEMRTDALQGVATILCQACRDSEDEVQGIVRRTVRMRRIEYWIDDTGHWRAWPDVTGGGMVLERFIPEEGQWRAVDEFRTIEAAIIYIREGRS